MILLLTIVLWININKIISREVIFWKIYLKNQIILYPYEFRTTILASGVGTPLS